MPQPYFGGIIIDATKRVTLVVRRLALVRHRELAEIIDIAFSTQPNHTLVARRLAEAKGRTVEDI